MSFFSQRRGLEPPPAAQQEPTQEEEGEEGGGDMAAGDQKTDSPESLTELEAARQAINIADVENAVRAVVGGG